VRRQKREQELADKLQALPTKTYAVILADPEWQWEAWSEKGLTNSSAQNHYPTSVVDAIKARNVAAIAADDCVLFLWATAPMLPQAIEVMVAWGFTYKTQCVWAKDKAGTGYWFRNMHELLLVGTRGKPPAPLEGTQWESLVAAPRGKHSEKPQAFYELIEAYFPLLQKVELNARKARAGWDCWGNEAPPVEAAA
jgi:N6-adenosine-specific RNA methylase IME4